MGLFSKWIARRGNPGGTARWAATGYCFFRRRHSDHSQFPDSAIFKLMIVARYESIPNEQHESYLLRQAECIEGLIGLAVAILRTETSFVECSGDTIYEFLEVISEELEKADLPRTAVWGNFSTIGDYKTVAMKSEGWID